MREIHPIYNCSITVLYHVLLTNANLPNKESNKSSQDSVRRISHQMLTEYEIISEIAYVWDFKWMADAKIRD